MTSLHKLCLVVFVVFAGCLSAELLVGMHYQHIERMADKQIELVKLQNICVDD